MSWYDTKQYDGEASIILEFGRIQSTYSLPSFLGSLLPGVVAPDWVLSMGQIELNCSDVKLSSFLNKTVFDI